MAKKEKVSFDQFYRNVYGDGRWELLKKKLIEERPKTSRLVFEGKNESFGKNTIYQMDEASIIAAKTLPLFGVGDERVSVLDLCSSPGGKGLVLWEGLMKQGARFELVLNEMSNARRGKLKRVLEEYLTEEQRETIFVAGHDGRQVGLKVQDYYDAILVDAPCSSESHVLKDEKELAVWSEKRPKQLAITQYALLCSALLALKPGGHILYSTCSINPGENDGVVEKLVKKKGAIACSLSDELDCYEKTEYGVNIFPDKSELGPIYFSLLKKEELK